MKYTKQQRLEIGRRIYEGEISRSRAAVEYDIASYTARDYLRLYKASLQLKQLKLQELEGEVPGLQMEDAPPKKAYEDMTREELIAELNRLQGK